MADRSAIEWTEATWNPTTGCDRVSPGCDNCYAMTLARRLKAMGQPKYQRDGDPRTSGPGFALTLHPDTLELPLSWRDARVVFVNSMSDLFHPEVPLEFVIETFAVMAAARRHTFQVLTKRPQRMASTVGEERFAERVQSAAGRHGVGRVEWPLPNVWLGTSIETDRYAWRAGHLRQTPAAVRFLSLEPLLGPLPSLDLDGIGWVIVGGESGPGARPLDVEWVLSLRDRCARAGVPFFFKQWGGRTPKAGGRELDGQTYDEMPALVAPA